MKKLLLAVLLIPFISSAQLNRKQVRDSIFYYQRQMGALHRAAHDSLYKDPAYRNAMERIRHFERTSQDYGSVVFFFDLAHADFDKFNTSIVASGFPPLKGLVSRIGFGFSTKTRNTIVDFYMAAGGLPKRTKKSDEEIETSFSSNILLDIGVDLAKTAGFNFYPYAGLSMRTSYLSYDKPTSTNPAFTNISNLIINNQSAEGYSIRLGVQAGIGLEFVMSTTKQNEQMADGGFIFFIKAGTNRQVGKERYKIEGVRYEPGIEYGKWIVTAGVKIFGRK